MWRSGEWLRNLSGPEIRFGQQEQIYTEAEIDKLLSSNIEGITKSFRVRGVKGILEISCKYSSDLPVYPLLSINPWEGKPMQAWEYKERQDNELLLGLGLCFNQTAKVTPKFKIIFPGGFYPQMFALVADWDHTANIYDATHYFFLPSDLSRSIDLVLPLDKKRLLSMMVEPVNDLVFYPQEYGP